MLQQRTTSLSAKRASGPSAPHQQLSIKVPHALRFLAPDARLPSRKRGLASTPSDVQLGEQAQAGTVEVVEDPVYQAQLETLSENVVVVPKELGQADSEDWSGIPGDDEAVTFTFEQDQQETGAASTASTASGSSSIVDVVEAAVVAARATTEAAAEAVVLELNPGAVLSAEPVAAIADAASLSAASLSTADLLVAALAAPAAPPAAAAPPKSAPAAPAPAPRLPPRRAPEVQLPLARMSFRRGPGAGLRPTAPAASRTFPPPFDPQRLGEALLGEPTIGPIFQDLFRLSRNRGSSAEPGLGSSSSQEAAGSGGPVLYKPVFPRPPGSPPADQLPLLIYLPGMDGTGLAAYRQFPGLSMWFDLRGVFLPPDDRTPFEGLVENIAQQLEEEATGLDPSRPVYLLGESFGGLMALELAQRLDFVDRVVLVNPATSFLRSPWPSVGPLLPSLPPEVYRLLPVALSPILSNPVSMALWSASPTDPPQQQAVDVLYGLLDLLPELSSLRTALPPDTLAWRLQLLAQGAEYVNPRVSKVRQRTLLLCGENDLVIPSASEGPRLERELPRCVLRMVRGGTHAMLQQSDVDLMALMQEADFYVSRRRLTRSNVPPQHSAGASSFRRRRDKPAVGGANFGTAGPIELPTQGEIQRAIDSGVVSTLRRLVSPVFVSTQAETGRPQLGLDALPAPGSGPVLFVGNHQLFALDMHLMVAHFLEDRGQLLRGLAHPTALGLRPDHGGAPQGSVEALGRFGSFLRTFGAVPVSGRNLYELLSAGEAALLYPGGIREALKMRDEQYELFWPRRAEFVRTASKFGATIVPFAGIGAEDSVQVVADRRDLLAAPVIGEWFKQQEVQMVKARRGVTESEDVEESFVTPLVSFREPARFYFRFGAPIQTDPRDANDRAAMDQLYGRVRSEVESCIGYLLRKREQDPYKDLGPRLLYEAAWGGKRQAPTFRP